MRVELTEARVGIQDGLEGIPVEKGTAAVTVLALSVVLAVLTHASAEATAHQVRGHVKVTAVRVAVAGAR
jgi:phytoene/squalene synthetase